MIYIKAHKWDIMLKCRHCLFVQYRIIFNKVDDHAFFPLEFNIQRDYQTNRTCSLSRLAVMPNYRHVGQQDLTRFAIQAKGPDGKWTRKPLAYRESNNVHLLITRPPEICVNLVFKHIHAASSYTICRQFVPFIYCPM